MYDFIAFGAFFLVGWIVTKNKVQSIFVALIGGAIYSFCRSSPSVQGVTMKPLSGYPLVEGMQDRKKSKRKKKKGTLDKILGPKKFPKGKYTFDPKGSYGLTYKGLSKKQMKGLRKDTKNLMSTQEQLMGTLKEMGPVLEQGKTIIGAFDSFFGDGASTKSDLSFMTKRLGIEGGKDGEK